MGMTINVLPHPERPTRRRDVGAGHQTCPRCLLTIRVRTPALALDYCPRCLARARMPVPMASVRSVPA
jgi:hypothetical protein